MRLRVVEGALKEELLTILRRKDTPHWLFRESLERLGLLLVAEALKELKVKEVKVETPVSCGLSGEIDQKVVFIGVLRAGLSLIPPALNLYPKGRVGFMGVYRNEETLTPVSYYKKYPFVEGAKYIILDPMLATGGTAFYCIGELLGRGVPPEDLVFVSVVCAPEGIERLKEFKGLTLVTAAVDERLNDRGYIVPGLGDAGDRFCGTDDVEVVEGYGV